MTVRVLPRADWPGTLVGTELEYAWPYLPPGSIVLVGEDEDGLAWCWAVVPYTHLEGAWIRPDLRGTTTAGRAWREMRGMLQQLNIDRVLTAALTDDVRRLVAHLGGRPLPGDHYVVPIGGR
jgi:hypothetical protein